MLQILGDQSASRIKKQTVFMHAVGALWTILANRCHCSRESSPKHKISNNSSKKDISMWIQVLSTHRHQLVSM